MKKQDLDNMACTDLMERSFAELNPNTAIVRKLRSCQAEVWETDNFYILRSYNTFVASIEKNSKYCADYLRKIYGYKATSAQHIAKFMSDYGNRNKLYRYR